MMRAAEASILVENSRIKVRRGMAQVQGNLIARH
jgi:hypothetical protein